MTTDNLSAAESLQLIQDMIHKTRKNISRQSHYFLLWGWAAFLACLGQFILFQAHYEKHYLVWLVTIPCIFITIWFSMRDRKRAAVTTYIDASMGYLWTGTGTSFFILSIFFIKIGWQYCYPFYILLYGLGTFVSGRILKFPPLLIGGIINWILALVAVWMPFEYQSLFAAGALLTSYIIPGHLFRRIEKQHQP